MHYGVGHLLHRLHGLCHVLHGYHKQINDASLSLSLSDGLVFYLAQFTLSVWEEFKDTKGVIRIRK